MATIKNELSENGIGLYIHLPFCKSKCCYCDFNSHAHSNPDLKGYIKALILEAKNRLEGLEPQTVFVGGGTPTLFPPDLLSELLDELNSITAFRRTSLETTMEANPESFTSAHASAIRLAGITRVSIGVQSLQKDVLSAYGRVHNPSQAREALQLAVDTFPRVNADLIYAFPGQSPGTWKEDLADVIGLGPQHLSCYELSYEPGTAMTSMRSAGKWRAEDPDLCEHLFKSTGEQCERGGLLRYEVSNFCQANHECLHNLAAWRSLNFVGIGAGACGSQGGVRRTNLPRPDEYQASVLAGKDPALEQIGPDATSLVFEHLLMGLRLVNEGVSRARVQRLSGVDPWSLYGPQFIELAEEGLLDADENSDAICATQRGLLLLDTILLKLLPSAQV
jgi:oxygen-independent coproporphyrinogen-3 oxidase